MDFDNMSISLKLTECNLQNFRAMRTILNLLQGKLVDRQLTLDLFWAQTKSCAATQHHYIS